MKASLRVWDPLQRVLHWALVLTVALAWLSTLAYSSWHQPVGYATLAIVLVRIVWGFVGSRYALFREFVRGPRATLDYLSAVRRHAEPRHLGHNPLGGWMVLALIASVLGLALTGWLYTTDMLWGDETVDKLHQALAWGMLALIGLHVAGVLFTSLRQRANLVAAMFTGDKPVTTQSEGSEA